jgi:glycosyltransferase involved in cell wall biosynthesis
MRILIAHEAAAGGGGVESYLAAVMPALLARDHQLAFLCGNSRAQQGPTRLDQVAPSFSVADEGLTAVVERVRAWRPDVCFSHNMRQLEIDERLMSICAVVKMMHGYFGTCIGGQKAHAFPEVHPCARTFGLPCLGLYLPRHCGQLRPASMLRQFSWASRQHRLFRQYSQVVVASAHMAREYHRNGLDENRVTTAPLFATVSTDEPPRTAPSEPAVLFLGRMTRIKGGEVLVRAAAHATRLLDRPVRLIFAGNGPAERRWRDLARRVGVPASFHGWVSGPERVALLRSASLVAVPSLWPEPFGLVGLEAAVHGVPAVAFDVGGIGEWLEDEVNGRIVREPGSPVALGSAIAQMLTGTRPLIQLGEGALRVAARLTPGAHLQILEGVLARAARPAVALA